MKRKRHTPEQIVGHLRDAETPEAFFEGWLGRDQNQAVETVYYPGLS